MGAQNKMVPKEKSWFDLYIELESKLTSRIFKLEERVKTLEATQVMQSPGNTWVGKSNR